MTQHWNERRLPMPRMHTGCVGYMLTGLLLVGAILAATLAAGVVIAGTLAGVG